MLSTTQKNIVGDIIYFNLALYNSTDEPREATFTETRTDPFVSKANDYYVSVVRFSIPTFSLPLITFPNLDTLPLYVGVSYQMNFFDAQMLPSSYVGDDFAVYSYADFLASVNDAYYDAYVALKQAFPLAPMLRAPYMVYEASTQLFSLIIGQEWIGQGGAFMGKNTYTYFTSLPAVQEPINLGVGFDYNITPLEFLKQVKQVKNIYNEDAYQYVAEYANFSNLNTLTSLIITSSTLPLNSEFLSTPGSAGDNITSQILTDFEPSTEQAGAGRSMLQYFANPLRYIEMNSTQEIRKLNLNIYWSDKFGVIRSLYILPRQSLTLKLMFKKKDLNY